MPPYVLADAQHGRGRFCPRLRNEAIWGDERAGRRRCRQGRRPHAVSGLPLVQRRRAAGPEPAPRRGRRFGRHSSGDHAARPRQDRRRDCPRGRRTSSAAPRFVRARQHSQRLQEVRAPWPIRALSAGKGTAAAPAKTAGGLRDFAAPASCFHDVDRRLVFPTGRRCALTWVNVDDQAANALPKKSARARNSRFWLAGLVMPWPSSSKTRVS